MTRRIGLAAAIAALTLATSVGGAQNVKQQGTNSTATRVAIDKLWDDVLKAVKAGDVTTAVSLYTPDAMVMEPSMADVSGRANIEKLLRSWFSSTKFIDQKRTVTSFEAYGDIAVETGRLHQTLQEKGKPVTTNDVRYVIVFKKVDGKWLAHRDIGTPAPKQ